MKKRGPKVDPCGISPFTGSHSDVWSFKTTLWNQFFKKLSISSNNELEAPIGLSLKLSP